MAKNRIRGVRLTPEVDAKLTRMAAELGTTPSAVLQQLIRNATVCKVERREPVAKLSPANERKTAAD